MWAPPAPSRMGRTMSSSSSSSKGSTDSARNPRTSDGSNTSDPRRPRPSNNSDGTDNSGLRWLGRLATVATSAAKELGMTDEEISSVKDTLSTSSTQLKRALSTGPQGIFSEDNFSKPLSDSSLTGQENSKQPSNSSAAARMASAPGPVAEDSDFPKDMAKALEDALSSKPSKAEEKVLSNTGLTGAEYVLTETYCEIY